MRQYKNVDDDDDDDNNQKERKKKEKINIFYLLNGEWSMEEKRKMRAWGGM